MAERDPDAATPLPSASQTFAPAGPGFCVVGIGASAGGLDACRKCLEAFPTAPGMAFILIQHLDPTHDSMMVELLTGDTPMAVVQAMDGMVVAADHVYLIPPGLYLAIAEGRLSLSVPLARHGARLPFDFLLLSLAASCGANAACVILSGGGADGAIGAQAIKAAGGLVIAQDPAEASHASMPESAIATGAVDFVLPASLIAAALMRHAGALARQQAVPGTAGIIALLKTLTGHDFTQYKTGTMERRIARRMAMAGFGPADTARYAEHLRADETECRELVNDLLINVTSFFRDPKVFELLAAQAIPELTAAEEGAIRVWVAGCSTGEETYSVAMLLLERLDAEKSSIRPQIFASDIDAQAVMLAREGFYGTAIEKDVSAARLARFFTREEHGYRVAPALRACVVFAVQDVLSDPPFAKLNMVSCRNLLIYLQPEAQEKLIDVFNFALRGGGFLLLGAAETVSAADHRFEQVSKPARLYRKLRNGARGRLPASIARPAAGGRGAAPPPKTRTADAGEMCRKLVLDLYAPATVLINGRLECLYMVGGTDAFLRAAAGPATLDLLAQLPAGLRGRVRDAVILTSATGNMTRVGGGRITRDGKTSHFNLEIQKVPGEDDKFLVCFLPDTRFAPPAPGTAAAAASGAASGAPQIADLETELALTKTDLEQAVSRLETAAEEHNAINEEALSANEEFQSTNEELLTSKEELQSLNEELTALNVQLQETLERSRTTSTDLRNVLYSTDVPTLFLDEKLRIRFFTPSATLLFKLLPGDIGRRLEDFRSTAADPALLADAAGVLATGAPSECEVFSETGGGSGAAGGAWYLRRIQAYRTFEGAIAGVVITFNDITERKAATAAVEIARQESDRANLAKSRFLAAASHDLRQPLQAMSLIAGMLAKAATDAASQRLIGRLEHMMQTITAMLNAMLDINQIEAGIVQPNIANISAGDVLNTLREKFRDQAAAQHTTLRVVDCGAAIATDAALLEQILTNLIGNALKYTKAGRVLVGCRRRGAMLRFEVWDSGIGIAADQLQIIFDEYHQIGNAARERSQGLGLGLSIVQRLGRLLGHKINVRSKPGIGSVFTVDVPRAGQPAAAAAPAATAAAAPARGAAILLVEDDPDISHLLEMFLTEEGFTVAAAHDAKAARTLIAAGAIVPDLILADFNLPGEETGLEVAQALRVSLGKTVPVIIVTGDISTSTLKLVAAQNCVQMNKPMKLSALVGMIGTLLPAGGAPGAGPPGALPPAAILPGPERPMIYIVDDDAEIRDAMRAAFEGAGMSAETYPDAETFLAAATLSRGAACVVVDGALPGISGLQLLRKLAERPEKPPAIMVTGRGDIAMAVQAMKAGATDFLEKPASADELVACVRQVMAQARAEAEGLHMSAAQGQDAARLLAGLTARQREVMDRVLMGEPSKNIAADLGISQRTVENHRAAVMMKTGARSIPALARLAVLALKAG